MSETSALAGRVAEGPVTVREAGLQGMVTLRADLGDKAVQAALAKAASVAVPERGRIEQDGARTLAWMSPDEALLILPHAEAPAAVEAIAQALAGLHHLAVNVSDARAMYALEGPAVRETLARLCPVDLHPDSFAPGMMRRTRMAQVPAAFWMPQEGQARVICFRSVAEYAFGLLANAASSPDIGLFGALRR